MKKYAPLATDVREQCPPTLPSFAPFLTEGGTSQLTDQVLDGTVDLYEYEMMPEMRHFLKKLKMTSEEKSQSIPDRMTREEFQDGLKIIPEKTSTSPSGLHYTIWKAIAENDDLSELHSLWLSLPFMYGFVCNRWHNVIEVMLEKKPNVRKILMIGLITQSAGGRIRSAHFLSCEHVLQSRTSQELIKYRNRIY